MANCSTIDSHANAANVQSKQRKLMIYMDEAKARQTTHWDLDYLTTAELDALLLPKPGEKLNMRTKAMSSHDWTTQKFDFALLVLAVSSGLWLGFLIQ